MARYFSVQEAATILGTTDRTIRRMLGSGRLSGSQTMESGKLVWRVHASKEILERLPTVNLDEDAVDVVVETASGTVDQGPLNFEPEPQGADWQRAQTGNAVEQFWNEFSNKFLERMEMKDQIIGSLQAELEEKDRQLKLLPDLQRMAAEREQAAELKELEAEALRKQIAALEQKEAAIREQELRATEKNDQAWKQQIAALKEKQASAIEQERRAVEAANVEVVRLRFEKEAETKAIQEQLTALTAQLQELKQLPKLSWWQKWFATNDDQK